MAPHYKNEAKHDTNTEVDPLVCHGGYHFPGILARVVSLHAVDMADKNFVLFFPPIKYIYIYIFCDDRYSKNTTKLYKFQHYIQ